MIKNLSLGSSNKPLLILALLLGVVCAVLVGVFLSSLDSNGGSGVSGTSVPVVVAVTDIPPLTEITPEMVTVQDVPENFVLAGSFADTALVVGKKTQVQVVANQQILTSNATDATSAQETFGPDAPLSLVVPDGHRAFGVLLSQTGAVGGLTRPGDHVDVILSGAVQAPEGETGSLGSTSGGAACVILQDVEVLAVGSTIRRSGTDADTSTVAGVAANPDATVATLSVTADQSVQLAAAQVSVSGESVGQQLWLSLRQFGDHSPSDTPVCTVPTGFGG